MSGDAPAILTANLSKRYDSVYALQDLNLRVERGEIFGFLGPNGAGKTTTIRLLLDLIRPTSGSASILGLDSQKQSEAVRAQTGYLPGDLRLYSGMRSTDLIDLVAGLRSRAVDFDWVASLASRMDLDLAKHVGSHSKGNRQKLGLLLAMIDRPPLLLLDEPTSGLDPVIQRVVWDILRNEASRGTAVFFSSHVMGEVEQICDRVGILRSGKLVAVETVSQLKAHSTRHVEVSFSGPAPAPEAFALPDVRELRRTRSTVEFEVGGEIGPLLHVLDE
jgi:ABC-2 type transport system ATP-binding protein